MRNISPLQPPIPLDNDNRLTWTGLTGNSISLAISQLATKNHAPLLIITPDMHTASQIKRELEFFTSAEQTIIHFLDWETLPYDHFSPHQDIISERLLTLYRLPSLKNGMVIASLPTLMHRLLPQDYLNANVFALHIGEHFDLTRVREQLAQSGYRAVGQVMEHGEFAVRGAILDIYPMGNALPFRVELFDDHIESIRSFDPETQRSIEKIDNVELLPAREYPLTEAGITHFRQAWRKKFSGNPNEAPLYQQISRGEAAPGIEYYLPLFFDETENFLNYLPENMQLLLIGDVNATGKQFWEEINFRYEQLRYDISRPLCVPQELFLPPEILFKTFKQFKQIKINEQHAQSPGNIHFDTTLPPTLLVEEKSSHPFKQLKNYLDEFSKTENARILFCTESTGRRETLLPQLKNIDITPTVFENWASFLNAKDPIGITTGPLEKGFVLNAPPLSLITESQLFGEQVMQRRLRKQRKQDPSTMIRNLTELNIGDPVVHISHGVGRYLGLKTIKTGDQEAEYLTLEYANNDKIYVPVSSLDLISRYMGADADHAPLQRLGTKQWEKIKEKTAQRIRDVAAELLDVYSRRENSPGYAFSIPNTEFQKFKNEFPFEETPDQKNAIQDVIKDMASSRSMDRLVCGDVGFGKTEVAMQAAFLATQANKQVAVLVPTTLLAEQHLHNFQDRFADWPIRIAAISRMRSAKDQKNIINELAHGKIDIIIGTHKLLSDHIRFKDLGLLIVDEEHRFGVRQKERIKSLRAYVDILTLTATPIPRTMNMALVGTRDLSIIATPPNRRLSVKTFVHEHDASLIREAVLRETLRGGQIYFLHNDVATINATAEKLRKIIPEARIATAHGQMRERELESVMTDFYHQKYNVLLCTTIIESGIDIPTANTIIINRADRFGLAQLHQLRGRVGRSHHQAYAYLLTPHHKALKRDAKKRLEAIAELDELGVGFNLATHDLEIRGAGELLGVEQSGHIHEIGFSLYLELLEEAVNALKAGQEPNLSKPLHGSTEIDLGLSALFPKTYVPDVHTRLTLYKRLASCNHKQAIDDFQSEMIDRFGLLPEPAQHLFEYADIRQTARKLGIQRIEAGSKFGYLHFSAEPSIDIATLVKLVQQQPDTYQLQGSQKLRFCTPLDPKQRLSTVQNLLKILN